ncbi:hypothetical protein LTR94_024516 [Friedmanniomyces endolithicus]|nr:hypothetical protein LTR94_024516 [Friedmanniomyces endolithicus]
MDGRVHVYRRENSRFWQCATYLSGRNHRQSTKQENLAYALEYARDWYLDRVAEDRLRRRGGIVVAPGQPSIPVETPRTRPGEKTFREAASAFLLEFEAMTLGERNAQYVASKARVLVQRELLNAVLDELDLKRDREGNPRTAYSLRHTYISMRLMEGADIYQVAKNCRTSVEMIEKYYASHIKNVLDASAINVRKPKPAKRRAASSQATDVD